MAKGFCEILRSKLITTLDSARPQTVDLISSSLKRTESTKWITSEPIWQLVSLKGAVESEMVLSTFQLSAWWSLRVAVEVLKILAVYRIQLGWIGFCLNC